MHRYLHIDTSGRSAAGVRAAGGRRPAFTDAAVVVLEHAPNAATFCLLYATGVVAECAGGY